MIIIIIIIQHPTSTIHQQQSTLAFHHHLPSSMLIKLIIIIIIISIIIITSSSIDHQSSIKSHPSPSVIYHPSGLTRAQGEVPQLHILREGPKHPAGRKFVLVVTTLKMEQG
jgi:hypothetical protein